MKSFYLLASKEPIVWEFHTMYLTNGIFTVPSSGYYRVTCIGKSGDGAAGETTQSSSGGGGRGYFSTATGGAPSNGSPVIVIIEMGTPK